MTSEMTDLEISKALALAIGWRENYITLDWHPFYLCAFDMKEAEWRIFDYRDWNVIGPIAERYDAFPYKTFDESWWYGAYYADTPQKAIAMAVINRMKK